MIAFGLNIGAIAEHKKYFFRPRNSKNFLYDDEKKAHTDIQDIKQRNTPISKEDFNTNFTLVAATIEKCKTYDKEILYKKYAEDCKNNIPVEIGNYTRKNGTPNMSLFIKFLNTITGLDFKLYRASIIEYSYDSYFSTWDSCGQEIYGVRVGRKKRLKNEEKGKTSLLLPNKTWKDETFEPINEQAIREKLSKLTTNQEFIGYYQVY